LYFKPDNNSDYHRRPYRSCLCPPAPAGVYQPIREAAAPFTTAIATRGSAPDIQSDGMKWWQRAAVRLSEKARNFAVAVASKFKDYWQQHLQEKAPERGRDDGGLER
jgi:hypothetical protein